MDISHWATLIFFSGYTYGRMKYFYATMESPIGPLFLVTNGETLNGLYMGDSKRRITIQPDWILDPTLGPLPNTIEQVEAYFRGELQRFSLPLAPTGTTFQQRVWEALMSIPYAATRSYQQLAEQVGNPAAVRAVGAANGSNPLAIILPCHRVIGADGSLTGYGGGLDRKAALLAFERKVEAEGRQPFNFEQLKSGFKQKPLF